MSCGRCLICDHYLAGIEFCHDCGHCAADELNRSQQLQLDNGVQCVFCKTRTAVRFEEYGRPICQWCTDDFRGRQLALAYD